MASTAVDSALRVLPSSVYDEILARRSFRRFVERVMPRYQWYRHCEALGDVLQRVADGEIRRLMVFMPPRHGKSQEVSRLFTAYYLHRYPERWVAVSSYGADLAYTLSRAAREFYTTAGGPLSPSSAAVGHWETGKGGGFWAAGVGGPCTGKGWNLGVIDDPVKNAEDAASFSLRLKQQEWYQSTFYTREEPEGGALVVIQTRWNELDLSGWLLSEERGANFPECWHVVNFAAIREGDPELPPSCTLEPDWREEGEALCPERYDREKLARIRERLGSYYWAALFQQRPADREGNFFRRSWFGDPVSAFPIKADRVRAWDLAASDGTGDYSVGLKMSRRADGNFIIEDVVRGQWSPHERDKVICQTAAEDGRRCAIWLEQEPGSAGKSVTDALIRQLAGYAARAERPTGDKAIRAEPLAAQLEAGNVALYEGDFRRALIDEFLSFPNGAHDDIVDAASLALNKLAAKREVTFF